jgi:hypothetical protein
MTHSTQIPTQLENMHPHVTHIINAQICDGLQEFQQKKDFLLLALHLMCKIPLVLAQADHLWRTPKSLVEPTWGFNYVEFRKVGTWGALPTSSTKKG